MSDVSFQFGTVGSPKSTPKNPGGSIGAIHRLAELGLFAFELGWVRSVRVKESTCEAIKEAAQSQGIALSVHAPYFINLNADDEEWPKSRQRLMDAAHYGYLAGATDIIFHPGSYFKKDPQDVLSVAIPRLEGCLQELRDTGNTVTLRPETMGKSAMLGSLDDTLKMSQAIPGVEPCIDFAHLFARPGDGSINSYDDWMRILNTYAEALGNDSLGRLHIHLSGIEYGPKGEKEHLPIQDSEIDLHAIFKALEKIDAKGRIVCESPEMEEDAGYMMDLWSEISGE